MAFCERASLRCRPRAASQAARAERAAANMSRAPCQRDAAQEKRASAEPCARAFVCRRDELGLYAVFTTAISNLRPAQPGRRPALLTLWLPGDDVFARLSSCPPVPETRPGTLVADTQPACFFLTRRALNMWVHLQPLAFRNARGAVSAFQPCLRLCLQTRRGDGPTASGFRATLR